MGEKHKVTQNLNAIRQLDLIGARISADGTLTIPTVRRKICEGRGSRSRSLRLSVSVVIAVISVAVAQYGGAAQQYQD